MSAKLVSSKEYVAGWLDSSVHDFLAVLSPAAGMKYALITCLDSNPKPASLLNTSPELKPIENEGWKYLVADKDGQIRTGERCDPHFDRNADCLRIALADGVDDDERAIRLRLRLHRPFLLAAADLASIDPDIDAALLVDRHRIGEVHLVGRDPASGEIGRRVRRELDGRRLRHGCTATSKGHDGGHDDGEPRHDGIVL